MSKQHPEIKSKKDTRVKLPVVLGIRPIFYIPVLYIFGILLLLFLLFVNPGLKNNGTWYSVDSVPGTAELFVDGVRKGSTPCKIFVPKGERVVELRKAGFTPTRETIKVKGRIFFSSLFPRKGRFTVSLIPENLESLIDARQKEFAAWGLAGKPDKNHFLPHIWTMTAVDCYRWGGTDSAMSMVSNDYLEEAMIDTLPFAGNTITLSDLVRGYLVHAGKGGPLTIQSLLSLINGIDELFHDGSGRAVYWLDSVLSENTMIYPTTTIWNEFCKKTLGNNNAESGDSTRSRRIGEKALLDYRFVSLSGGTFFMGDPGQDLPARSPETEAFYHESSLEDFLIMENVVPMSLFVEFASTVPEWSFENKRILSGKNLADDNYLGNQNGAIPEGPAIFISWYAAKAFCRWFTNKHLAGTGYYADLPTETEWEYAANVLGQSGEVWEWCSTGFSPYDYCFDGSEHDYSPEASVRGGCSKNEPGTVKIHTRAGQPKNLCSPYTGFRIVMRPVK